MTKSISIVRSLLAPTLVMCLAAAAHAAVPGITGPTFNLVAQTAFLNQPDGNQIYSWGYGCNGAPAGFAPAAITGAVCPTMQVPGPTLIVTEGATVSVTLTNQLPAAAGNTSILFPGFNVTATNGVAGLLTQEAAPAGSVTYTFTANSPGTHAYYSGSQSDLQVEMGMYGAIVVIPSAVPAACTSGLHTTNQTVKAVWGESDFRLAPAAYDNPNTCYDREYLFQWAEMDTRIHNAALAQIQAIQSCTPATAPSGACPTTLNVPTEPYHPAYFLINGRSMPDLMDANFAPEYPHQPYNGNPHMHPGDLTLIRTIGQGRWQHPFHEHANHVRILARDGNLILAPATTATPNPTALAGQLMFNTDTTPGEAFDGIFYFTGRGLNWDAYGHRPEMTPKNIHDPLANMPCNPDANGYYTALPAAPSKLNTVNYYEWCQDHNKPLEAAPIGDVAGGGPATLPNPNIFANGPWYGGTPYLGPDATLRGGGAQDCASTTGSTHANGNSPCAVQQPSNIQANPSNERGWAYMWHSHNEREITTNNVFPGGMLMMMLVDTREFVIDENN
jgi:hypothetical protein